MEFKFIFPVLGLFLISTAYVEALRCYSCSSLISDACLDPEGKNATTIDCSTLILPGAEQCYKITGSVGGKDEIDRGCMDIAGNLQCELTKVIEGLDCYVCDDADLCNSSNIIGFGSITFLFLSLLAAKLL